MTEDREEHCGQVGGCFTNHGIEFGIGLDMELRLGFGLEKNWTWNIGRNGPILKENLCEGWGLLSGRASVLCSWAFL